MRSLIQAMTACASTGWVVSTCRVGPTWSGRAVRRQRSHSSSVSGSPWIGWRGGRASKRRRAVASGTSHRSPPSWDRPRGSGPARRSRGRRRARWTPGWRPPGHRPAGPTSSRWPRVLIAEFQRRLRQFGPFGAKHVGWPLITSLLNSGSSHPAGQIAGQGRLARAGQPVDQDGKCAGVAACDYAEHERSFPARAAMRGLPGDHQAMIREEKIRPPRPARSRSTNPAIGSSCTGGEGCDVG